MKVVNNCFFFLFLLCFNMHLNAQDIWSLEKCVNHALSENLGIKQTQLTVEQANLTEKLNRNSRNPSLNGSSNFGYQLGRTIDPTTNSFSLDAFASQTLGLNASAILYNGGRINNSIEQSKLDAKAAKEDLLQNKNDIALTVATAFINTLFAKERTQNAIQRLDLTAIQIENTSKLIQAGALPANDILDLEAQEALNQQEIILQKNAADLALLNLKLLLQIPVNQPFEIEVPSVKVTADDTIDSWTMEEVYDKAVNTQPFIKAGKYRMESASLQEKIAKAEKLPRLAIFGGIDTRFSDQVPLLGDPINRVIENDIILNGNTVTIGQNVDFPNVLGTVGYFDQLSDNLGQNVGLSLNIPIYNNGRANIAQERAKLNMLNTQYSNEQLDQRLKTDIQQAITDAKASKLQLRAAQKALDATKAAFENTEKRFNIGAANSLDLSVTRNRMDAAEIDLIVAKYQYLFNIKVVDFYRGVPITF